MSVERTDAMVYLCVRHNVNDYAAWKKVFDDSEALRKGSGMKADTVYQAVDNPNDVTVVNEFESLEQAKSFVESPALREGMAKAGVAGSPTIWFVQQSARKEF
jgi:heme-degrading monooxygenase HmoA